jgi:hypothetical protein
LLQRLDQFLERSHFVSQRLDFGTAGRCGNRGRRFHRGLSEELRRSANGERYRNKIFHLIS